MRYVKTRLLPANTHKICRKTQNSFVPYLTQKCPAVIIFHKQVRNKDLSPFVEKLIEIAHRAEREEYLELVVIEKE